LSGRRAGPPSSVQVPTVRTDVCSAGLVGACSWSSVKTMVDRDCLRRKAVLDGALDGSNTCCQSLHDVLVDNHSFGLTLTEGRIPVSASLPRESDLDCCASLGLDVKVYVASEESGTTWYTKTLHPGAYTTNIAVFVLNLAAAESVRVSGASCELISWTVR
jgi:hypothetical protein